jgi:hypothetical protein
MTDFAYPLFPVFALLGAILPLVPLAWHLQAWNSGTCFYMLWASVICLNQFVNSILWHETAVDFAPVWCDICMSNNTSQGSCQLITYPVSVTHHHCRHCRNSYGISLHQPQALSNRSLPRSGHLSRRGKSIVACWFPPSLTADTM